MGEKGGTRGEYGKIKGTRKKVYAYKKVESESEESEPEESESEESEVEESESEGGEEEKSETEGGESKERKIDEIEADESDEDEDDDRYEDGELKDVDMKDMFSTVVVEPLKNGLKMEYVKRGGKRDGPYKIYYPNGKIKVKGIYKDDKKDGPSEILYESGNKSSDVMYVNDLKEGSSYDYYDNKLHSLKLMATYHKGLLNGPYIHYAEDGGMISNENYDEGDMDGKCTYYHTNGRIRKIIMYNYDDMIDYMEWSENGKVIKKFDNPELLKQNKD